MGIAKKSFKPGIFIILNFMVLLALLFSLFILTSGFPCFSWHEESGAQMLAIPILVFPCLFIIGIMLFILGRFYHISPLNKDRKSVV